MSSDPPADAFLRSYLRQPNDITARLVFADWLDGPTIDFDIPGRFVIPDVVNL